MKGTGGITGRARFGFALALLVLSGFAQADTLLTGNVMVTPTNTLKIDPLTLTSAGTLTVTVTDLAWPQALQSLSFAISDSVGVLKSINGAGSLVYVASGPMALFANVFATPSAAAGSGLYHIDAYFAPAAPTVPLPAAAWLLISGLVGFSRVARTEKRVQVEQSNCHRRLIN